MVGTATHAITAARVTSEGDCPQLPALLAQTRVHHDVREVSADKAYSSVENHDVLESFGVEAFIPFKVNAVVNPKVRYGRVTSSSSLSTKSGSSSATTAGRTSRRSLP
jgi:predicted transcriptional regulator